MFETKRNMMGKNLRLKIYGLQDYKQNEVILKIILYGLI